MGLVRPPKVTAGQSKASLCSTLGGNRDWADRTGLPGKGWGVIAEAATEHPSLTVVVAPCSHIVGMDACLVNDQNKDSEQCRCCARQATRCPPASSHKPVM